jgi:hypothetical protein
MWFSSVFDNWKWRIQRALPGGRGRGMPPQRLRFVPHLEAFEDRLSPSIGLLVGSTGYDTDSVLRYNGTTGVFLGTMVTSGSGGLDTPHGFAFTPEGNLLVASAANSRVLRYDETTGTFLSAFVPSGSGGLDGAPGIVYGPDGNLYVSSAATRSVLRYNGTTGAFMGTFVASFSGGLDRPHGLVFGPDGNLYVNSSDNNSVMRYDGTTGDPLPAPNQPGATFVASGSGGLSAPYGGLVFGPDGNLYVSSYGSSSVLRYNGTTGAFINAFVPTGSGGLSGAHGITFGPDRNLYVVSQSTDSVLRYDGTTGAFINPFVTAESGGLSVPTSLIFRDTGFDIAGFPSPSTAGVAGSFIVTAKNRDGTPDTAYTGTIHFSSNDPQAVLPADYTFTPEEHGVHIFSATFKTAGIRRLTVTDAHDDSRNDVQNSILVVPAAVDNYRITSPASIVAGSSFAITVTARDAYENTVTGYTGNVHFSSSDVQAVLPNNYTFTSTDVGAHTFRNGVTLKTAGNQTVTATDTATGSITGSAAVTVNPAVADHLLFLQQPTDTAAGQTLSPVVVELVDAFGNVETGDNSDTITLSIGTNPSGGTLSGTLSLTVVNGVATFSDLSIDLSGSGYTLHATIGGGLPDSDSDPFAITL